MNSESIENLLAQLFQQGIRLNVVNGKLRCRGPAEVVAALQRQITDQKEQIVDFLKNNNGQGFLESIPPIGQTDQIPLSFAQQRLWFLEQMQPESAAYNLPFAVRIDGLLDRDAFRQSLNEIVKRHEVFRTNFIVEAGEPHQKIAPVQALEVSEVDLRGTSDADLRVKAAAADAANTPFDLSCDSLLRVQLFRIEDEVSIVVFTVHHIIADGWSTDILLRELGLLYRSCLLGKSAELRPLPIQYSDYSIWQRNWLQGEVLEQQLGYWKEQLGGDLPTLNLQTDYPRKRVQTFAGAIEQFSVPKQVVIKLQQLSKTHSATLFMTLLASFNLLLRRYSGQIDLVVGTPIANRHRPEVEGLIGLFVNTLVIRTKLNPRHRFVDVLRDVRQTTLEAYQHQDLPFEKLVETLQPNRDMSISPLFQVKFRLENAPPSNQELPGLKLSRLPQQSIAAKLDLSLDMYETADGLVGAFEYNRDLFNSETVQRMATHFVTLLTSIADAPERPVAELPLLSPEEQQRQQNDWNLHDCDYQDMLCFHECFEAQASRSPDAIALIFDDETTHERKYRQLTYCELNEQANQLAGRLRQAGIGPEVVVAICLDRSPEMVIGMLAVLKAGGAYLPLDSAYPEHRLRFLLEDAGARVLLTHSRIDLPNTVAAGESIERIDIDTVAFADFPKQNLQGAVRPDNLAYLIYTSGSAGQPKGVLVSHRGLVNLTEDKMRVCDIRPADCVLQFFSFSFDGSVPEFVMTLASGAKLLMAPASSMLPGEQLRELLIKHKVSHITMTPSALTALPHDEYPSLRMVLVGGEAPSPELIATWAPGRTFINAYGPTETTVNASMVSCGNQHPTSPTLLPSVNKQLYVLDEELEIAPIGAIGELHIGGVGIARGYHRQPVLTAERFIPNPFPPPPDRKYKVPVLYKTGDLACYLSDGRIRITGRVDQQTKLRGFRIELPEIERILEQHPDVKAGLVRVREDVPGNPRLVAYAVSGVSEPDSPSEVQKYLAEKLPKFMLPSAFIWIPVVPLTENGKLDETALPAPTEVRSAEWRQPQTDTEAQLAAIFAEVLAVENVGIGDNFFDLGGHSLLATRLVSEVMKTLNVEMTVIDLFDAPTVSSLAQRIEHKQHLVHLTNTTVDDGDREEISL